MNKPSSHIATVAEYEIFHSGDLKTTTVVAYHGKIKIFMASQYSGEEPFSVEIPIAEIKDYGDLCNRINESLDFLHEQVKREDAEYVGTTYERLTLNNLLTKY